MKKLFFALVLFSTFITTANQQDIENAIKTTDIKKLEQTLTNETLSDADMI
jgi:hypothetical protein